MKTLRVLVVEDSLTVRARLCEVLAADPEIRVVGEAADGKQAIELCAALRPDVVTLDMMLPVMSGLAATEYIMAYCPTPILVVSASLNRGELFRTYDALAAGAVDVLEKPLGDELDGVWERKLIAAVKMVARIRAITHPRARLGNAQVRAAEPGRSPWPVVERRGPYQVVAIGASTGGPGALLRLLQGLPADFGLPVLVVLHISEPFSVSLSEWLDGQSGHRVSIARDGLRLAARGVYMAPAGRHLSIRHGRLHLSDEPERHACRPSVDVLFHSIAREFGATAIACLLTGMGRDGADGMLAIREAGGQTIAQDEASCVVYGMPREAVELGAAERVLPLADIGPALAALAQSSRRDE